MHAALALNLDARLLRAALPLLEAGEVGAVEWSFDALYQLDEVPTWFTALLEHFGGAGRLVGHGVFFSLFDGRWRAEQDAWLRTLRSMVERFDLRHVSEHFGFMSGADFHRGAPLSVPMNAASLRLGHDRLLRLADAARRPVGLENLALAYGIDDVHRQGEFLDALLEPVGGFLILDLHNLYCQAHNFDVDASTLLDAYPLDRVRELHLAGGSWVDSAVEPGRRIRRDTHSDRVPEEVFTLLDYALPHCPHAQLAVLEQMGGFLGETRQVEGFRADFRRLRNRLPDATGSGSIPADTSASAKPAPEPLHDEALYAEQRCLVDILTTSTDATDAAKRLQVSPLADSDWGVETWDVSMVETALRLARKWA